MEVIPEVYSGKLFSPGKTGILESRCEIGTSYHFGYFFVRLGSAEMYSKMSLARTQICIFAAKATSKQALRRHVGRGYCVNLAYKAVASSVNSCLGPVARSFKMRLASCISFVCIYPSARYQLASSYNSGRLIVTRCR